MQQPCTENIELVKRGRSVSQELFEVARLAIHGGQRHLREPWGVGHLVPWLSILNRDPGRANPGDIDPGEAWTRGTVT